MNNDEMNTKEEEYYLKTLSNIFTKIPIKDRYKEEATELSIMDKTNVVMITSKSKDGIELIRNFVDLNNELTKDITINYESGKGSYNMEYLKHIMKVFEKDDRIKIQTGYDQPMTIENKHFKIIVAPKIEN